MQEIRITRADFDKYNRISEITDNYENNELLAREYSEQFNESNVTVPMSEAIAKGFVKKSLKQLACIYEDGAIVINTDGTEEIIEQNEEKLMPYLERLYEEFNERGTINLKRLGNYFLDKENYEKAEECFKIEADKGDKFSTIQYLNMKIFNAKNEEDLKKIEEEIDKILIPKIGYNEDNSKILFANLGMIYKSGEVRNGNEVRQDMNKAVEYFVKSEQLGLSELFENITEEDLASFFTCQDLDPKNKILFFKTVSKYKPKFFTVLAILYFKNGDIINATKSSIQAANNGYVEILVNLVSYIMEEETQLSNEEKENCLKILSEFNQGYLNDLAEFYLETDNVKLFLDCLEKLDQKENIMDLVNKCFNDNANEIKFSDKIFVLEKGYKLSGESKYLNKIAELYHRNGDTKKAIEYYKLSAEDNDAYACFQLGNLFWLNLKTRNEALKCYEKAGELGCPEAFVKLGDAQPERNIDTKVIYYKKAAELGDVTALKKLVQISENMKGQYVNNQEKERYLKDLVEKYNDDEARFKLANMLKARKSKIEALKEAAKHFNILKNKGNKEAEKELNKLTKKYGNLLEANTETATNVSQGKC